MHIYAYFPKTTGNYVIYFQYTVRGGFHTRIVIFYWILIFFFQFPFQFFPKKPVLNF